MKAEVTMNREKSDKVSKTAVLASAWPALILATICLLPFLNKPFLLDDPWFLMEAQQIVRHPAHPMDFNLCWNEMLPNPCMNVYQFEAGNVLLGQIAQGYVLVPSVLTGAHEWTAHVTELVLAWIAVLAMTSLIFRFGWDRRHATAGALLLVAIPPFLAMASTVMPDILATVFALVAMERAAAWKAERKWGQGIAAAISLGLAGLARPHLFLLLPLAAFFLLENMNPKEILARIREQLWLWAPIFAGFCVLAAAVLAVREYNVKFDFPPAARVGTHTILNLFSYLSYFTFPLPLAVCWLVSRLKNRRLRIVIAMSAVAVFPFCLLGNMRFALLLVWFLSAFSCGVLANLFLEALKMRDHTGLFLVLWVLIPLPIVYYQHLPIRYLLPCMPAVVLLCFRLTEGVSVRIARAAVTVLIVASTVYSLLILRSDAEFAEFGRDALYHLIRPHVAEGERVWFAVQYWSYWYAPLAGATLTFPGGPQPKPGDLLVVDLQTQGEHPPLERFPRRTLVETVSHKYRFGRTMGAGIGLHSNGFGYWLWGFGDSDNDRFELWRID